MILFRKRVQTALLTCLFAFGATAASAALEKDAGSAKPDDAGLSPETFYAYMDDILDTVVVDLGHAGSESASPPRPPTGTRIAFGSRKATRLSGNRVMYSFMADENIDFIRVARLGLQASVESIDMPNLTKDEQLAFWLNLHNITVMEVIANRYPVRSMKTLIFGKRDEPAVWDEKIVKVGGVDLSIHDIEQRVITGWKNPLVLYGFYMGAIGTPDIRRRAYRGSRIWYALEDNAREYINSPRGAKVWGKRLRVARYYEMMGETHFPDFKNDVKKHVVRFIRQPKIHAMAGKTIRLSANIQDWDIADLTSDKTVTSAFTPISKAGLLQLQSADTTQVNPINVTQLLQAENIRFNKYPPELRELIARVQKRNYEHQREGTVDIEEVSHGETPEDEKPGPDE